MGFHTIEAYVEMDSVVILYFISLICFFHLIQWLYLGLSIPIHLIVNIVSSRNMVHMPFR
jgi:hypothetical protein